MNELEQLQAELIALRSRAEKRSFKQVMKDGYNKVRRIMNTSVYDTTNEELIIQGSVVMFGTLLAIAIMAAFVFFVIKTNGLTLLLLPIYPLYLIFRKPQ